MNKTPSSTYKIRFNDCDMFGHLNNARYLDYMINARQDHLQEEYNFDITEYYKNNIGWVAGSHEIVYLKPALYNEAVSIQSQLINADTFLLHVETIMTDADRKHVKAVMRTKLIPVNIQTGRRKAHKPELLEWVLSLIDTESDLKADFQERIKQVIHQSKQNNKIYLL
ncbi:MAG: acyl-CoA thioesterase [Bacteroidota bacterium]